MKIVLALATVIALAGCGSGGGDVPGPADSTGQAMSNTTAEDAIKKAPPEMQEKIREQRAKSMNQSGPPPAKK
jgi:hypothetical protein